jgi:hypothetical protein
MVWEVVKALDALSARRQRGGVTVVGPHAKGSEIKIGFAPD